MNLDQAITIIEQALNLSAKQGVFNLKDSTVVSTALDFLLTMKTQPSEEVATEEV